MRPTIPRTLTSTRMLGTGLVIGALAVTLMALLIPVQSFGSGSAAAAGGQGFDDDGLGTVSTPYGPLSPLDRDFVRRVRLAGLWELPAGREAQQRGEREQREAIKNAGDHLVMGHTDLDRRALKAGEMLGIPLPNRPTAQQQGWLDQMQAAQGIQYEQLFANLLRAAHGKVFTVIAQVRAQSRNSMVRALATVTNSVVLDHITVLEETGMVDFDALNEGK
ncbi:DUF4142 domain-containing protein [Streptomyces sp. NPDC006879]|uniref:DUF4142 domain-containing protein n=1 Tax=Streptomyces sp. NPDC006879 TaxID=3364767 RepID=UPI0036997343